MNKNYLIISVVIGFFLFVSLVEAKPIPPYRIDFSILDIVVIDQPVNLTVDVTPTSDSSNFSIGILLPEGIELVKGDLIRKVDGSVTRGEKVQFNATIKVVKEGHWEIKAIVGRDLNETWYEHAGYLYINASGNETTVSHFPPQLKLSQAEELIPKKGTKISMPSIGQDIESVQQTSQEKSILESASTTITIFSEDFEGSFPGSWTIGDSNSDSGDDYWRDTSYKSHWGDWSAWIAEIGSQSDYEYGLNSNNVDIPDEDRWVYSPITISSAPSGATVSSIDVHYEIIHTYRGDLDVDLNDYDLTYTYDLHDPDVADSADNIIDTVYGVTTFNGEFVNQEWDLWAKDVYAGDTGYIDYWWIKSYWTMNNWQAHQYDNDMDAYMRRTIDLTGYTSATLEFWHLMPSVEGSPYDYGQLKVNGVEIRKYDTPVTSWTKETIDLSSYVGSTITIEWNFHTDSSVRREGWYIDDIKVEGTTGTITVNGYFYYWDDNTASHQPIRYAKVELWDSDVLFDDPLETSWTSSTGYYSLGPVSNSDGEGGTQDIYVVVKAEASAVKVIDSSNNVWEYRTDPPVSNVPDGTYDMGSWTSPATDDGAYNIHNVIIQGYQYVDNRPDTLAPAQVTVKWYPGNTDGTHYHPGGEIHILGSNDPTNWAPDEWDNGIVLHEYGHYIAYIYNIVKNSSGGSHFWSGIYNNELAWSEGWGHYFSSVARSSSTYRDTWSGGWVEFNLETGIARRVEGGIETARWDGNSNGAACEASVAGVLWDIYDSINDDQNEDGIGDTLYTGSNDIWDVIHYYSTGGHGVYHIHEFWNGWFNCPSCSITDHNYLSQMNAIFWEHGIDKNDPPPSPTNPTNLGDNLIDNTPDVSWSSGGSDPEGDIVTYTVESKDSSGVWVTEVEGTTFTSETLDANTWSDGEIGYWRVKACDPYECSAWSPSSTGDYFRINTPPPAPTNPTNLGDHLTDYTPTVSWSSGGTDAEGDTVTYNVESRDSVAVWDTEKASTSSTSETLDVNTWSDGEIGYWRVRSYDGYEYSAWVPSSTGDYFKMNTPPPAPSTYNISLNFGWNLISIPLEQSNWSLTSVLAPIEGKYNVVFAYIDGGWKRSTSTRAPLTEMSREYGYWINMTDCIGGCILEISGRVPSVTTMNVNKEWNLMGFPSLTAQNLTIVLSPINYTVVFEYRNGGWKRSTSTRAPLTHMSPGYGYWINATGAGSYGVEN